MSNDRTKITRAISPRQLEARPGSLALEILEGTLAGQTFAVAKPLIKVGRSRVADLTIADHSVSKLHFSLRVTATGAEIQDLGSKNGLWLGPRRIFHVGLVAGDVFTAGECRLRLVEVGPVEVEVTLTDQCGQLHGASLVMRELFARLERVAPTPLDVLIQGETGTGKEIAARSLHDLSDRHAQPFVVLDCASIPTTLADATLFGFRRGAFTGADHDQPGLFEQGDGGTVFIDEIGELSAGLQTKLLRVLDRREVSRLGEPGHVRPVDVRVLAATNRDLIEEVAEGRFREDLFHRLSQETLIMPPLRERDRDVVMIAERFVDALAQQYELGVELGEDARAALQLYNWPGNVRELRNVIRRAALLRRSGTILAADLRFASGQQAAARLGEVVTSGRSYEDSHLEFDRMLLPAALAEVGGNLTAAAGKLQISRDRLRRRLLALGLYGGNDD